MNTTIGTEFVCVGNVRLSRIKEAVVWIILFLPVVIGSTPFTTVTVVIFQHEFEVVICRNIVNCSCFCFHSSFM